MTHIRYQPHKDQCPPIIMTNHTPPAIVVYRLAGHSFALTHLGGKYKAVLESVMSAEANPTRGA